MSKSSTPSELAETSRTIFIGLLVYMPLHILLSTWIGTSFGVLAAAKVAKDGVMLAGFLTAVVAAYRQPWFKQMLRQRLIWLIAAFAGLNLLLALIKPIDQDAETLGVVYNTRFFVFFLYGLLLARLFEPKELLEKSLKAVLLTATFVLFFGIVQYTILPDDALSHIGYNRQNGVLPAFFIDDKPDLERAMSTLRDPNSFGSYIIIIGSIALAIFARSRIDKQRKASLWLLVLSTLAIVFTFSRSAWLGFMLAAGIVLLLTPKSNLLELVKKRLIVIVLGLFLLFGVVYSLRGTYLLQNVIFHADESTILENPNQLRARFYRESAAHVINQSLGHGPGTAGLASIRNDIQGVHLTENYYLQMAHELGVLGLVIFVTILSVVGMMLYRLSGTNALALGMFASFIGLAATNFLVHIWANEAVAYTWWGLAGILLAKQAPRGRSGIISKSGVKKKAG